MIDRNNLSGLVGEGTVVGGHDKPLVTYEDRLSSNSRWALNEGSEFFEGKSSVQHALRKIVRHLDELGVPYAVVGGLALFEHGYRRFTEDVDLLVTTDGLRTIHEALDGLGYLPPFKGSKHLRDTEFGVKIEFLVEGGFPGDGKPKSVSFPNPAAVSMLKDGIRYLNLPTLINLKLASGMTNIHRRKDLLDVFELIKILALPRDFDRQLDAFVRNEYDRLWDETQTPDPNSESPPDNDFDR